MGKTTLPDPSAETTPAAETVITGTVMNAAFWATVPDPLTVTAGIVALARPVNVWRPAPATDGLDRRGVPVPVMNAVTRRCRQYAAADRDLPSLAIAY